VWSHRDHRRDGTPVAHLRHPAIRGYPHSRSPARYGIRRAGRAGRRPREGSPWLRPCRQLRPWRGRPRPRCRFSRRRRPDSVSARTSGCRVPAGVVERVDHVAGVAARDDGSSSVRELIGDLGTGLGERPRPTESRIPGDRDRGQGVAYRTPIESSRRLADRVQGRCCVDRSTCWPASETLREFGERCREQVVRCLFGRDFVVSAAEVLNERVTGRDGARGAQPLESAHRSQSGFQASVIGFDDVVRVLLEHVPRASSSMTRG
jgi:hypothetical protein